MAFREMFVADPVEFMKNNIVTPQFRDGRSADTGPPKESRPIVVTLQEWAGKKCSKANGGCYYLSRNTNGLSRNQKLPIYWLAYKDNDYTQGVLNGQSLYMFTALMNGCSLGFGSQNGDGGCLISHANKKSAKGGVNQQQQQHDQLAERFEGGIFSEVVPSAYGNDDGWQATNFAKNVNGTWRFYTHKFMPTRSTGGVVLHGGCDNAISI